MGYGLILPTRADAEYGVPEAFGAAGIAVVERPTAGSGGPLPTHVLEVAGWKVVVIVGPDEPDADPEFLAARYVAQAPPPGDSQPGAAVPHSQPGAAVPHSQPEAAVLHALVTRMSPEGNARLAELLGDEVDVILGASSPARSRDYRDPIEPGPVVPVISRGKALTVIDVFANAADGAQAPSPGEGQRPQPGAAVLHAVFHARFEPVAPGLYEDATIRGIVDRYYAEAAPASRPAEADTETEDWVMRGYADPGVCGACHASAYATWRESAHAKAIPTLREQDRLVDECLQCHSEEFRRNGAFDPEHVVPEDGVTCSTCHGKGLVHAMTGEAGHIGPGATPEECMACHNEEQQPLGFDFAQSWEKVKHGMDAGGTAE